MAKPAIVHLTHAPMVLRIEEKRTAEDAARAAESGQGLTKLVGEIELRTGRNEIDADLWAKWLAANKDNPLVVTGAIMEGHEDGKAGPDGSAAG